MPIQREVDLQIIERLKALGGKLGEIADIFDEAVAAVEIVGEAPNDLAPRDALAERTTRIADLLLSAFDDAHGADVLAVDQAHEAWLARTGANPLPAENA